MGFTTSRYEPNHLPLGYHPETGQTFHLSEEQHRKGMYVIGKPGSGKSGYLETLIHHEASVGHAVIVIDPHGDLVDNCLASLPPDCLIRTSVLDMEDETWPFGLNVFAQAGTLTSSLERGQAMEQIYHIFEVLWPEIADQQYLPTLLKAATTVFLDNPGCTLLDMDRFFLAADVRSRMLASCQNQRVREFFQGRYDTLTEKEQENRVKALLNRLNHLSLGRDLVANILGQRHQALAFRKAIDRREIVFIKLPVGTLGSDAQLIGTFLLGQISAAIFSYADTPHDQRPGVSLFVDEVQNFTTPDFSRLIEQARKYAVRLTIAHQHRGQFPTYLKDSTSNTGTIVCFRINPDDATELGKLYPAQDGELVLSTRPTRDLITGYYDCPPVVQDFIDTYLRGLPKDGDIRIDELGMHALDLLTGDTKQPKVTRPSPLLALDGLFREVMKTGNGWVTIPPAAVEGLANGGMGFFPALKWTAWHRGPSLVSPEYPFPPHLVVNRADGMYWTRKPQSHMEQLQHCIFHLRATLVHLAAHPIGTRAASKNATGDWLKQLPVRTALVQSGDTTAVIYTHNTAEGVRGHEKTERFRMIRDQTRARYCAKREEVSEPPTSDQNGQHIEATRWSRLEEVV